MKKMSVLILSVIICNLAFAAKAVHKDSEKSPKIDVNINMPYECTRSGSFSDDFEMKCAKLREVLTQFYKENPEIVAAEKNNLAAKKNIRCEEVTDHYVICNGSRYILELDAVNNTYQQIKKVNDEIQDIHKKYEERKSKEK